VLGAAGYQLRRLEAPPTYEAYDLADEIGAAAAVATPHTMVAPEGIAILYQQAHHCVTVPIEGALVECGVWHGGSSVVIAGAAVDADCTNRQIHLFDSFQGIPEPDQAVDGERAAREVGGATRAQGRLQVAWDYGERGGPGSASGVRDLLAEIGYPLDNVHVHEGWFEETVPAVAAEIGPIALLHLDGDWYSSTKICLEHLDPFVSVGGFVTVNDYGAYAGCQRAVDEYLLQLDPRPFLCHVNDEIRYWIKPGREGH
jgi:O-methyltransferase